MSEPNMKEDTLYNFRHVCIPELTWGKYRGKTVCGPAIGYRKEETCQNTYEDRYYFRSWNSEEWHEIHKDTYDQARPASPADIQSTLHPAPCTL